MQNNATTDIVSPPLDAEDWQIAFGSYIKHRYLALALAQHLAALQGYVQTDTGQATAR